MSPFLQTGTIFEFFQVPGKVLVSIQFYNNMDRGVMIDLSHNFSILTDISSCPWALLMSRAIRTFSIWSSQKWILEMTASDSCSRKVGKTLSFFKTAHFEAKKLLKWSDFLSKWAVVLVKLSFYCRIFLKWNSMF